MATSGFSSTLSLAMVSLPLCSSAISSSTGLIILQGPHHSAQKSTSTGVLDLSTSLSNVASVTAAALLISSVRSGPRPLGTSTSSNGSSPGAGPTTTGSSVVLPTEGGRQPGSVPVVGRGPGVVAVGLQPALGVDRGRAAGAGGGHRLPVGVVDDVAGREHAVDAGRGRGRVGRDDVAGLVELDLATEQVGVRGVADGHEHPGHRQHLLAAVLPVAQPDPGHGPAAAQPDDGRAPIE